MASHSTRMCVPAPQKPHRSLRGTRTINRFYRWATLPAWPMGTHARSKFTDGPHCLLGLWVHTERYAQMGTHTDGHTHRWVHTQMGTRTDGYTHRWVHTDGYTQMGTRTDGYTHRWVQTQTGYVACLAYGYAQQRSGDGWKRGKRTESRTHSDKALPILIKEKESLQGVNTRTRTRTRTHTHTVGNERQMQLFFLHSFFFRGGGALRRFVICT